MSLRSIFVLLICAGSLTARQTSYLRQDDGWIRFYKEELKAPGHTIPVMPGMLFQGCDMRATQWVEPGSAPQDWRAHLRLYGAVVSER